MQRFFALAILLVAGMLSLPVAATAFDGEGSENWILPAQLGGMAALGVLVALAVPDLARGRTSALGRSLVGAGVGVGMAVVGVVTFFLILNGFDGA